MIPAALRPWRVVVTNPRDSRCVRATSPKGAPVDLCEKIGYDNNSDDDIDDARDDIVVDEDFSSDRVTVSHDHAGNLIDDGTFCYVYDSWNRLVAVRPSKDMRLGSSEGGICRVPRLHGAILT